MLTIRLAFAASLFATLPVAAQNSEPAATVTALIQLDTKGDWTPIFANEPTAVMRRFFTPAFNAAWRTAMTHNTDYPVFDADPLTGAQASGGPVLKTISADPQRVVAVTIVYRDMPAVQASIRYVMVRDGTRWRVDDIAYPDNLPSLRAVFAKSR